MVTMVDYSRPRKNFPLIVFYYRANIQNLAIVMRACRKSEKIGGHWGPTIAMGLG